MKKKSLTILMTSMMVLGMAFGACAEESTEAATENSTEAMEAAETEAVKAEAAETEAETEAVKAEAAETEVETKSAEEQQADAEQLLADLKGTYEELFKVNLDEKYAQMWIDHCAAVIGEEDAQAAADMLRASISGEIYGQEAVDAYTANPDSTAFDCYFIQDVAQFTFDGNQISGTDADGKEVFSHTYSYVGMDETSGFGFAEFKSDDADAGEFTYILLAPDTPATTYHIEFRYGSDLDALTQLYTGDYAYWMAAGILADADDEMVEAGINLFCTENLAEAE
ncbi:MAG: hypothetical protein PHE06_05020 [Lachnospiraceae bacterium]|nr:hypothetical protein [Lachnospiraceae bacterium]MDD3795326.1 hypothetical protein [Lachnospiraceae bacterium]